MKKIIITICFILAPLTSFSETTEVNVDDIRKQIYEFAMTYLDTPYKWGSEGPKYFDCSGFVNYIYDEIADINLPRVSSDMSKVGEKTELNDLKIGDLVFFKTTKKNRISHVGIYIGENKFIHASSAKKKVIISEIKGFYKKSFRVAKSFF